MHSHDKTDRLTAPSNDPRGRKEESSPDENIVECDFSSSSGIEGRLCTSWKLYVSERIYTIFRKTIYFRFDQNSCFGKSALKPEYVYPLGCPSLDVLKEWWGRL